MKNKYVQFGCTIAFAFILLSMQSLFAQNRLYMRFADENDTAYSSGVRLKAGSDGQYWILGAVDRNFYYIDQGNNILNNTGHTEVFARVNPLNPVNPPHGNYPLNLSIPNGESHSYDFTVDPNNTAVGAGFIKLNYAYTQKLSVLPVLPNLTPSLLGKRVYDLPDRIDVGKSILTVNGAFGTELIMAFETRDLPSVGSNQVGVCSINPVTYNINWLTVLNTPQYIPHAYVKDMVRDTNGNFVIVGYFDWGTNAQRHGMISKVSSTGAILWQKYYTPNNSTPTNVLSSEFTCITTSAVNGVIQYIVSGNFTNQSTNNQNCVLVGSYDVNGNNQWGYEYHVVGTGDPSVMNARHMIARDGTIILAGTLYTQTQSTWGTLLHIKPQTIPTTLFCEDANPNLSMFVKWRGYGTKDPFNSNGSLPTLFADVIPKMNGLAPEEVAVVGTAWAYHNNYLVSDVLWMDTDNQMFGTTSNNCKEEFLTPACSEQILSYLDITPTPYNTFTDDFVGLSLNPDTPWRDCSNVLSNTSLPKHAIENDVTQGATTITADDIEVSPIPNTGSTGVLQFTLHEGADVTITISDMKGLQSTTLISGFMKSGKHMFPFNSSMLTSGMYAVTIQSNVFTKTIMVPIIK
ncbi:MAG: hypothetical protein K1X91_16820 [Bacteriodetes bacterium]|nr:hypothetical protein [Bacteroidota bacterium]